MDSEILNNLYGEKGFFDKLSISINDLQIIRKLILSQFQSVLSENHPDLYDEIKDLKLPNYHQLEEKYSHILEFLQIL